MKKFLKVLIVFLVTILSSYHVSAAVEHVFINTDEYIISDEQIIELEVDLVHIQRDYGISIYVVYDKDIGTSNNELIEYGENFANNNFYYENNVGLFINSQYYYINARGNGVEGIEKQKDELWKIFYEYAANANNPEDENLYNGILAFAQNCVKIINGETYEVNVPGVNVKTPFVNDFADLFSESEEEALNKRLADYRSNHGMDAVIVTTNSTNGLKIADYADDFYDYNGYGDDGILMVLDMSERSWYFSTKGRGIKYFTDYGIDQIFNDMQDDLSRGSYYEAFNTFADDIETYTRQGEQGNPIDYQPEARRFGMGNVIVSAVIGLITTLISAALLKGQLKSVAPQRFANNYIVGNSFTLTGASDLFVNRSVTRSRRPQPPTRSMGGGHIGGSSVHTSSSGSSHGGHGGHF